MKRLVLLPLLLLALIHCEDHLSTQEANAVCEGIAEKNVAIDGKVFDECVACYENCEECRQVTEGNETVFKCPDDIVETE